MGSTDEIHLSSFPRQVSFISVSTAHRPTADTRPIPPAFPCCPFAASGPQAEKCSCSAACPCIMETLNKARLTALYAICLQIFRHIAQKSLAIRQYACGISMQSAEKSDDASYAQSLFCVSIMISHFRSFRTISDRPFLRGSSPHKKSLHYIHNRAPRNVALSRKNF